jgi:alkylation response protein AidB-like acyl-CoA dehydrogenase
MNTEAQNRVEKLLAAHPPADSGPEVFLGAQFDLGLAWASRPEGLGGFGAPPGTQAEIDNVLQEAGAPTAMERNPIGVGMAAPTLFGHANDADLQRLLRPLFTGAEIWCQMFSEPGAGSDVAALGTRAVRDGDDWVVNGQKIWTSRAHLARWGLLLTRTDPTQPKHLGMTYFFVNMNTPGIEVRPLRQATGDADFNEVFLTGVRVPDAQRLADVGRGWQVAIATLMNERVSLGALSVPRGSGPISEAVALWQAAGRPAAFTERLTQLWVRSESLRLMSEQAGRGRSAEPGPEGSIGKLVLAELNQQIYDLCVDLLGADGMLYPEGYKGRPHRPGEKRDIRYEFVRSLAATIEGGTSEIMRNILGERVLGLPPEARADKDMAWADMPR